MLDYKNSHHHPYRDPAEHEGHVGRPGRRKRLHCGFRLQRDVHMHVIADGNVLVASCGWARRNVLVGGQRVSVRYGQALRVHRDYRRQGLGDAVRLFSNAMNNATPSIAQYDIMRSGNFAVVGWWNKHVPGFFAGVRPGGVTVNVAS